MKFHSKLIIPVKIKFQARLNWRVKKRSYNVGARGLGLSNDLVATLFRPSMVAGKNRPEFLTRQQAITCSKLTIETLEQGAKLLSSVSIVNFEQVNAGWTFYLWNCNACQSIIGYPILKIFISQTSITFFLISDTPKCFTQFPVLVFEKKTLSREQPIGVSEKTKSILMQCFFSYKKLGWYWRKGAPCSRGKNTPHLAEFRLTKNGYFGKKTCPRSPFSKKTWPKGSFTLKM